MTPRAEISMPNWAGTRASFKRSRTTALENRMPKRRPPARVTAAQNRVSQKHIRAMCRFSSPKMLYRPSSRWRRFMTKLLAYSKITAANSATITHPRSLRDWRYMAPRTLSSPSL